VAAAPIRPGAAGVGAAGRKDEPKTAVLRAKPLQFQAAQGSFLQNRKQCSLHSEHYFSFRHGL
jgi:hypothetical protein